MSKKYGTAELGIDGNAGFALVGENLQEGEAEFVTVPYGDERFPHDEHAECWAATQALRKLEERLGTRLSYYIGPSHPRHLL